MIKSLIKLLVALVASSSAMLLNDNSLSPLGMELDGGGGGGAGEADWVALTEPPPRAVRAPSGSLLELECEAAGTNPRIEWLRGQAPAEPRGSNALTGEEEGAVGAGLRKVRSRLQLAAEAGAVTCVAWSGARVAAASTAVLSEPGAPQDPGVAAAQGPPPARVLLWHPVVLAPQRSPVTLPCRVSPAGARALWLDPRGRPLPPRLLLPDGSLRIPSLAWRDMGSYTCIASTPYAKDSVSTFLYPLAVDE